MVILLFILFWLRFVAATTHPGVSFGDASLADGADVANGDFLGLGHDLGPPGPYQVVVGQARLQEAVHQGAVLGQVLGLLPAVVLTLVARRLVRQSVHVLQQLKNK